MCVIVREKYVVLMLLRANRAAGLRVKGLQDIFEIDCTEMALMIAESENNSVNKYSSDHYFYPRHFF